MGEGALARVRRMPVMMTVPEGLESEIIQAEGTTLPSLLLGKQLENCQGASIRCPGQGSVTSGEGRRSPQSEPLGGQRGQPLLPSWCVPSPSSPGLTSPRRSRSAGWGRTG